VATVYPSSLDSFSNPSPTDPLSNPAHAAQHGDANDAIEAIESTLGVNPQGSASTVGARIADLSASVFSASAFSNSACVSASNAANSALLAGDYAASTQVLFTEFDARYLGAKSASPATDNTGAPLTTGALYFDSVSNEMQQYTSGSAWISVTGGGGNFISASVIDAKGDLIVGLSDDTVTRLPVGASNQALIADSSASVGVKWAAVAFELSPTFTGTPTAPTASVDTNTTQIATTAFVIGQGSSASPAALGVAASGTSLRYSRQDHVHPTTGLGLTSGKLSQFASTTSAELAGVISDETGTGSLVFSASPAFTGVPTAPTASVSASSTQIATTAFVVGQAASATPIIEGTGAVGTSLRYAREDHVHPTGGGGGGGAGLSDVFLLMGA
jgi:hypothetical protein